MKKLNYILRILSLLVVVLLLLTACTPVQKLVGLWQGEQANDSVEFFNDGTVIITSFGIPMTGNYSILDDSRIKMEISGLVGLAGEQIVDYSISEDTLYLTIFDITTHYTKVK